MASAKQEVFAELMSERANRVCVDCSTPNPQWASVSHGSFLCIKCAGVHRSMGVHISFVRSVTMDSWSSLQLEKMKAGGNRRFRTFLTKQQIPNGFPQLQKYDSEVCELYRKHIASISSGNGPINLPFIGFKKKKETQIDRNNSVGLNNSSSNNSRSSNNSHLGARSPTYNGGAERKPMMGFGSDGQTAPRPSPDESWSWDNISSALKSAASTVADKSSAAATVVAERSRAAAGAISVQARRAQELAKEQEYTSNFSESWGAIRTAVSTQARSMVQGLQEDADPPKLYVRQSEPLAAPFSASSSSKYGSGVSSADYFASAPPRPSALVHSTSCENVARSNAATFSSSSDPTSPRLQRTTSQKPSSASAKSAAEEALDAFFSDDSSGNDSKNSSNPSPTTTNNHSSRPKKSREKSQPKKSAQRGRVERKPRVAPVEDDDDLSWGFGGEADAVIDGGVKPRDASKKDASKKKKRTRRKPVQVNEDIDDGWGFGRDDDDTRGGDPIRTVGGPKKEKSAPDPDDDHWGWSD